MTVLPLVTVIVPTRQEVDDIDGCLAAIAAQDYPVNRLEVVVVDGCSTDGTAEVARRALRRWDFDSTAVLSNEGATASSNLNVGLSRATGEIVCRVDARTRIEPHYVRTCVDVLTSRREVAVVGGAQVAVAREPTARAVGIARALNNRWSMGGSPYRRATDSGESDTVYLGTFRRADLLTVGGWDERLVSNQDFDLNRRMAQRGLVWFDASLRSQYMPRATLAALWSQYHRFGRAKVIYWRLTRTSPERRQLMLLSMPALLVAAVLMRAGTGRPRHRTIVSLALGAAAAIDQAGSDDCVSSVSARVYSVAAMTAVASGWLTGAYAELMRGDVLR